jgi:Photosynthetic reaction centre cytochrome C subunit
MKHRKKITLLLLGTVSLVAISATITAPVRFKNLQVLPKDITEKMLDSIMGSYNKALNVDCNFCHSKVKDITPLGINPDSTDYAADNSMKENARKMIHLTVDINKKYFYFDSTIKPLYLNTVNCYTCHRGNPYPVHD